MLLLMSVMILNFNLIIYTILTFILFNPLFFFDLVVGFFI
jgi:hypothetical protein